jgi:hypothetical protein
LFELFPSFVQFIAESRDRIVSISRDFVAEEDISSGFSEALARAFLFHGIHLNLVEDCILDEKDILLHLGKDKRNFSLILSGKMCFREDSFTSRIVVALLTDLSANFLEQSLQVAFGGKLPADSSEAAMVSFIILN